MSRLTQDIYAIQFPSSRTDSNEHVASANDSTNPSLSNNSYVNLLVLNRVRLNSGLVQRFGAPIGNSCSLKLFIRSNCSLFSGSCTTGI